MYEAERETEIVSIDRIELPGGVSPSGEATIADKAACLCVLHEKVLAGEFPQVLLIRGPHRF